MLDDDVGLRPARSATALQAGLDVLIVLLHRRPPSLNEYTV